MPRFGSFGTSSNKLFGLTASSIKDYLKGYSVAVFSGISTFPAHIAGDIIIVGLQTNVNTTLTPPAGWTQLATASYTAIPDGTSNYYVYGKIATGSGTAVGTWTNSFSGNLPAHAMIYRGFSNFGACSINWLEFGTTSWPALTCQVTSGTSIIAGYSWDGATYPTEPTGYRSTKYIYFDSGYASNMYNEFVDSKTGKVSFAGSSFSPAVYVTVLYELKI